MEAGTGPSPASLVLIFAAAVAALYLGRDVFIPLALAILLSFALGPLVTRLSKAGVPRVPSVVLVVTLLLLLVSGFAAVVAHQLVGLAESLPRYEYNLRAKVRLLATAAPAEQVIERTADVLREMGEELQGEEKAEPAAAAPAGEPERAELRPIPVEVRPPPASPLATIREVAGPLFASLATAGLVIVFIIFVLLQREDLRDRLIRLAGVGDVQRTTQALDDAARRIGRYLLMQLVINVTYGLPVGIGLYLIGVPNAPLWGLLATVLRFIPYAGPVLAALFPIALSLAVEPGWTTPLLTIGLFVTLELFSNNVMEPWLYGASTGLSPLAIIVAAVFWTTLWGPVGLLLATPLTVCLVVIGHHVPQLSFLEILLGDEPVLAPEVRFYQRLLADDPDEAGELLADLTEERPLAEVVDRVVLPALQAADQDRRRDALPAARMRALTRMAASLVDDLAEPAGATAQPAVACVAVRGGLDEGAALILASLLREAGLDARLTTFDEAAHSGETWRAIALCGLDPEALRPATRAIQRLRPRAPVCLLLPGRAEEDLDAARQMTGAEHVVNRAVDAVGLLKGSSPELRASAEPARAAIASAAAG